MHCGLGTFTYYVSKVDGGRGDQFAYVCLQGGRGWAEAYSKQILNIVPGVPKKCLHVLDMQLQYSNFDQTTPNSECRALVMLCLDIFNHIAFFAEF